ERHLLGQTALVQLERRTNHDHGASGVVYPLTEEVLPEAPLLALEHVAQALEGSLVGSGNRLTATTIVEQCVHCLLKHAALIADDDLWSIQLQQSLQAIVAVDDSTIQVVQIAGCEATAIQRNERAQVGRQNRDDCEHHPLRAVPASSESFYHLESLCVLLALRLTGCRTHIGAQLLGKRVDIHSSQHLDDGLTAHCGQ